MPVHARSGVAGFAAIIGSYRPGDGGAASYSHRTPFGEGLDNEEQFMLPLPFAHCIQA